MGAAQLSRDTEPSRRSILLAAGLSLIAATTSARPADRVLPDATDATTYATLVFRYASDEHAAAVDEARRLTAAELRRRLDWLLSLRENARGPGSAQVSKVSWCPPCSQRDAWERFPLLSAVLLHAEAAWPTPATGRLGRDDLSPAGDQLSMALNLAQLLPERASGKESAVGFFVAVGYRMQDQGNLAAARSWTGEGLRRFPRDPLLLLAAGTMDEALAEVGYASPSQEGRMAERREAAPGLYGRPAAPLDARVAESSATRISDSLDRAAQLFQAALDAQPDLHEARLRLGRVEWQKGHRTEAERLYRQVLAAESSAEMRYLAQLFLGRLQEDQGLFDDAASSYRAALALDPDSQTALLALSHALYQLGAEQDSQDLVEQSLALAGRRKRSDVFGAYFWGRSASYRALWEALRAAARKEAQP
jgi:tetratricopeptide (TPR) repeat protein